MSKKERIEKLEKQIIQLELILELNDQRLHNLEDQIQWRHSWRPGEVPTDDKEELEKEVKELERVIKWTGEAIRAEKSRLMHITRDWQGDGRDQREEIFRETGYIEENQNIILNAVDKIQRIKKILENLEKQENNDYE